MIHKYLEILLRVGTFVVMIHVALQVIGDKTYERYVHVLCDVMLLSMVLVPGMALFNGQIDQSMKSQIAIYTAQLLEWEKQEMTFDTASVMTDGEFLNNCEREIKSKLNNVNADGKCYKANRVTIHGIREDGSWDKDHYQIIVYMEEIISGNKSKIEAIREPIIIGKTGNENKKIESDLRAECAKILQVEEKYVEVEVIA